MISQWLVESRPMSYECQSSWHIIANGRSWWLNNRAHERVTVFRIDGIHALRLARHKKTSDIPRVPAPCQTENKAMLSRQELARRWGVSTDTIRRREQEGLLASIRFNSRLVRYRREDVEAIERRLLGSDKDGPATEFPAFPAHAIWSNQDHDKPVVIAAVMGIDEKSSETYFMTEDGTGIPESKLVFDS